MKSSWEVKFAKLLFIYGINFEYEPFFIQYEYNNSTRKYFPDFYICDTNIIFEVKPINGTFFLFAGCAGYQRDNHKYS